MLGNAKVFLKEKVLYINDTEALSYRGGDLIYRKNTQEKKFCKKNCHIGDFFNKFSLMERLMRKEPRCAVKLDATHILVSFNGQVLNYDTELNAVVIEHHYDKGMKNPLEFLSIPNQDGSNDIYYGEYIWNDNKCPVAIYKRTKQSKQSWSKVYEFSSGKINHIHNLVYDTYRKCFLILTGDDDDASGVWFADVNFQAVKPILLGNQQYRACVAFPTEKGFFYATDTPLEENRVYFAEIEFNSECPRVKNIKKVYDMPGPCIYGAEHDGLFYFSTSVEPDTSLPKWIYRLSYRLGEGVKNRYAHIICGDKDGNFQDIFSVKKDIYPIWLFQFGNILYPKNDSKKMYAILQCTKMGHGVTIQMNSENI